MPTDDQAVPFISQHLSSSKGSNEAHSIDFELLLQLNLHKTPMFAVFAVCSEREAHQL